ncbi:heat shock protein HSP70 [Blastocystis sp. subtype 4]|uniref:heat shock protein HSP70 n=1 Tax=Blastocystis sp. subtype 4 TaxID=944170 RepID=UPI00071194C8|nr:heat shock protein HSP70 [Blastocystis sp. subtype 4]KNB43123.1 heat shock protein HSP70 [Blastocystis sp. subtype 4]|eukprot:XP_014526566.1 heat shock protein HSP70 [Blastocystis sp. subtype 4]
MSANLGNTISIDLGTTFSTGCYLDDSGKLSVIEDPNGIRYIPSVVTFGSTTIVGEPAAAYKRVGKSSTFYESKRLLAKEFKDPEVQELAKYWPFTIVEGEKKRAGYDAVIKGEKRILYPEEVSAQIIKYFCDLVEKKTNRKIEYVVITVPAFFDSNQRTATMQAAAIAGRKCIVVIDEPTAAAVDFSVENDLENKTLVVYDLGGGTFDVSVMAIKEKEYRPICINGDSGLGGANFTNLIYDIIVEQIRTDLQEPDRTFSRKEQARIQNASEETKIALSTTDSHEVNIELDDNDLTLCITRVQFEDKIRPLIQRTVDITKACVNEAGLPHLDYVAMIGGSTTIPLIKDMLATAFPLASVKHTGDVRAAVARGAFMRMVEFVNCRVGPGDHIVSENAEGILGPERTSGMVVPERTSGMVVPERASGMVVPERMSGMVVPERASGMIVPERMSGMVVPERMSGMVVPERMSGMVVPEEREGGVEKEPVPERRGGMVVPEDIEDGIEPVISESGVVPVKPVSDVEREHYPKGSGMVVPEKPESGVVPVRQDGIEKVPTNVRGSGMVVPERPESGVAPERPESGVTPERPESRVTPERPESGVAPERPESGVAPDVPPNEDSSGSCEPPVVPNEPCPPPICCDPSPPSELTESDLHYSIIPPSLVPERRSIPYYSSGARASEPEFPRSSVESAIELPPPIALLPKTSTSFVPVSSSVYCVPEPPAPQGLSVPFPDLPLSPMFPSNPPVIGVLGLDVGIKVRNGTMDVIIPRGKELPVDGERVYVCDQKKPVKIILYQGNRVIATENQRIGSVYINMQGTTVSAKGRLYIRVCVDHQNMVKVYIKYHKKEEWTELKELNQGLLWNDEQIDRMREEARKLEVLDMKYKEWTELKIQFEQLLNMYKTHGDRDIYDPSKCDQWEAWMNAHSEPPKNWIITDDMISEWTLAIEDIGAALEKFF